jgi:hypothetical protein
MRAPVIKNGKSSPFLEKERNFVKYAYLFLPKMAISGSISFCPYRGDASKPFCQPSLPFSYGSRVPCSSVFSWVDKFFS